MQCRYESLCGVMSELKKQMLEGLNTLRIPMWGYENQHFESQIVPIDVTNPYVGL